MEDKFNYSKAIEELEGLAKKVEYPQTSLEDIGDLVKRSNELIEACRNYLRTIRESIEEQQ